MLKGTVRRGCSVGWGGGRGGEHIGVNWALGR